MKTSIFSIKNILGSALVAAMALSTASCSDDFLDLDNPNQPSSSTFWSDENDALMGLTGCYDAMQNMNLYNDHLDNWNFGFLSRETCTDNGDHSWGNWMLGSSIAECTSGTSDECFSMYWNCNYELIKRCNEVTANIDRIAASDQVKNLFRAEAMALRALGYCNLTSVFRDVPYFTEPLTMSTAQIGKTDKATIVDNIITELKANIPNLPAKGQNAIGRMSREAAYAILGRVALFAGRYDDAIDAYKQVYGKATLFKSGDGSDPAKNFADLFTLANENADEVLLSIHYKGPALGEGQTFGIAWKAPMNAIEASMNLANEFYCTDGLPITESPLFPQELLPGNASAYTRKNQDLRMWENRDPRMKGTIFVPGMTWNGTLYNTCGASSTVHIRKWYIPENTQNEYDGSMDYYVIRYAEVLLSYAEALIEKGGNNDLAISLINEIRNRVAMPTIEQVEGKNKTLTQADLRAIVRHERRVELAFEDLRFADVYRWGIFSEMQQHMITDRANGFGTLNHQAPRGPQDNVWPIPQGEIDTNPNLVQHDEWK